MCLLGSKCVWWIYGSTCARHAQQHSYNSYTHLDEIERERIKIYAMKTEALGGVLLTSSLLDITNRLLVIYSQLFLYSMLVSLLFSSSLFLIRFSCYCFCHSIFRLLLFGYFFIFSHIFTLSVTFLAKTFGYYSMGRMTTVNVISRQIKKKLW